MAYTTTTSRRTITVKGGKRLRKTQMMYSGSGGAGPSQEVAPRPERPAAAAPKPRPATRWWRQPELLISIGISLVVIAGLAYIAQTARPNTGYPQDEFVAGANGAYAGYESRSQPTSQERTANDQSFLAFARAQHAKSEASRIANMRREAPRAP